MTITRDILDNGRHIIHVKYDKKEVEAAKKHAKEMEEKLKKEKPSA